MHGCRTLIRAPEKFSVRGSLASTEGVASFTERPSGASSASTPRQTSSRAGLIINCSKRGSPFLRTQTFPLGVTAISFRSIRWGGSRSWKKPKPPSRATTCWTSAFISSVGTETPSVLMSWESCCWAFSASLLRSRSSSSGRFCSPLAASSTSCFFCSSEIPVDIRVHIMILPHPVSNPGEHRI